MLDFKGWLMFTGWMVEGGPDASGKWPVRFFLPGNPSIANDFLAIRDLKSFSLFFDDYGMAMLAPMLEARMKDVPGAPSGNWSGLIAISDAAPEFVWLRIRDDVEELQGELQRLMKQRREKQFFDQLNDGLSGLVAKPFRDKGSLWMVACPQDIKQACYLCIALGDKRFGTCKHCSRAFIQTKRREYCSDTCKNAARDKRRSFSEVEREKRRLNSLLNTRHKQKAVDPPTEGEIAETIRDASSLEALAKVERQYPVMKRQRNRR